MDARQPFPRGIFGARDRVGKPLPAGTRVVLAALWSYARWWESGAPWVYPSPETLHRLTAVTMRSVWRALAQLDEAGLIRREQRIVGGARISGWLLSRIEVDANLDDQPVQTEIDTRSGVTEASAIRDAGVMTEASADTDAGVSDQGQRRRERLTEASAIRVSEESPQEPAKDRPKESAEISRIVDGVIAHLTTAQRKLNPRGGTRDTPKNRDKVRIATKRERASLEDWHTVIDRQLASVRRDPGAWRYLCLSTLCRADNFARLLEAPEGVNTRGRSTASHAPSLFDTTPSQHPPTNTPPSRRPQNPIPTIDEDDIPL